MKKNIFFMIFSEEASVDKAKDAGMALTLLILLIYFKIKQPIFVLVAVIVLAITMIYPKSMKPIALIWFGVSHCIGKISTTLLMTFIFLLVIIPSSVLMRLFGKDSLHLKDWKVSNQSVFNDKMKKYATEDIEKPY